MEKRNRGLYLSLLGVLFLGLLANCTNVVVYGKDYITTPKHEYFQNDREEVSNALKRTLDKLGYQMDVIDDYQGHYMTRWRPVEGNSHYAKLFDRRDYGVSDGAYYQLLINFSQEGPKIRVTIQTNVKTVAGPLESSGKVEKRVLAQMANYLRPVQINMTNVGVDMDKK